MTLSRIFLCGIDAGHLQELLESHDRAADVGHSLGGTLKVGLEHCNLLHAIGMLLLESLDLLSDLLAGDDAVHGRCSPQ